MKKILYVENDERLQFLIREELGSDNYEVITASNGKDALDILFNGGENSIDLIIMDIHMPKMDGMDTIGHILKSELDKPLIVYTGYSSYKEDALAMSADAYILKSHDLSELKETIHNLIGKHQGKG
ncbi:MAG TPA: response regulator [Deltaproteobacteria bacterium]|nr:response regulator [Deltaproteobacteria bacterium]